MEKHTFAVVAYKESPFLEECIKSLKKQTIKSEIYITTSTPSVYLENVAVKYNIRLIVKKEALGIAQDWTFAYKECNTEYITLAHQDDIYLPEYTKECLKRAQSLNGNALIIFTGYREISEDGGGRGPNINLFIKKILLFSFLFKNNICRKMFKKAVLSFGDPIPAPTIMYNKKKIGALEFCRDFKCNMDWKMLLELSGREGFFAYVKNDLVLHRIHKNSQTYLKILSNERGNEDLSMYSLLWPKPIARVLAWVYRLGLRENIKIVKVKASGKNHGL